MNSRQLLSAIGKIDEKYVRSAEKTPNKEDRNRIFTVIKSVAAAVFAVAVIGTVWIISYKNVISKTDPTGTQSDVTDPTVDAAPDLLSAAKKCLMQSENKKVYYAKDGKSYYKDDLRNIYFCINVGDNYVLEVETYGVDYPAGPDGQDIGAYHFYYPAGYGLIFVNAADGAEHYLWNAYYDEKLINDEELSQVYNAYTEFINKFYKEYISFEYKVPEAENGETFLVTINRDSVYSDFDFENNEYIAAYLKCIYAGVHEDYNVRLSIVPDEMINKNIFSHNGDDGKYDKYFTQKSAELGYSYDEAVKRATEIARTIYPVTINEVSFSFNGIYELSKGDFLSLSEFSSYIERYSIDANKITKAVCIYTDNISVRFNDIINLPLDGSSALKSFIIFEYKGKTCVFDLFSPDTPIGYIEDMADGKIDTIEFTVTVLEAAEHAFIDTNGTAYVSEKPLSLSAMDIVNVEYYRDYTSFVYGVVSVEKTGAETYEIIPEDYVLYFNETDKITNKDKAAELKKLFDNYLKDKSDPDDNIEFCVKLSDNKYAAKLKNVLYVNPLSSLHMDVAGGYPIITYDYSKGGPDIKIIVLSGDDIYYGAETAYNRGIISDSDAYTIYNECRYKYYDAYYSEITGLLYRSMTEFLNGRNKADNKSGTGSKTTYYKFINISFCLKLRDEKYAVIYYVNGEPIAEFESMDVNIKGYKFVYKNGNTLWVYDDGKIYDASHANLTDDEAARLYGAYNKYMNANPGDRAKAMTAALDQYLKNCKQFLTLGDAYHTSCPAAQTAGMYNDYYVRSCFTRVVDGQTRYYAFISDPDENFHMTVREEKIGGLTFNYSTSENLKVIIGAKVYNSLREAYDAGVMSKRELEAVYTYLFQRA